MKHNKTAVITGSSRGIGAAIAQKFAENNYNVVLNCAKSTKEMAQVENQLKRYSNGILAVQADVSSYQQAEILYHKALEAFGSIDILVNNAGIASYGLFTDTAPDLWQEVINANLFSAMNMCYLAIKNMVNKKSGAIINISSIWGITGASCETVYAASKGGLNTFTKSLAKELGPSGINVNAVACGVIDTAMNRHLSQDEKEILSDAIPLMRFGKTAEVASMVLYLASEEAKYINGQIITVDGGMI